MTYRFGKSFLEDLEHKLWNAHDNDELLEDYQVTKEQINELLIQFPACYKTKQINIPQNFLALVKGEMQNMAEIAWHNAKSDGVSAIGYATAIETQLKKL